jgi:hypothetical protein
MATIEVEQAVQEVETEDERVMRWRRDELRRAGYDERLALKLALRRHVDLHLAVDCCAAAARRTRRLGSSSRALPPPPTVLDAGILAGVRRSLGWLQPELEVTWQGSSAGPRRS